MHIPKKPVYVYYRLKNFYQNHRLYTNSYDPRQLYGIYVDAQTVNPDCHPFDMKYNTAYFPCGKIANSIFNGLFCHNFFLNSVVFQTIFSRRVFSSILRTALNATFWFTIQKSKLPLDTFELKSKENELVSWTKKGISWSTDPNRLYRYPFPFRFNKNGSNFTVSERKIFFYYYKYSYFHCIGIIMFCLLFFDIH